MKYVKCPKCGAETPDALSFCRTCKARLPKEAFVDKSPAQPVRMHGFISFCLWTGFVLSALLAVCFFALMFASKGLWTATPEPFALRLFWFVCHVCMASGYMLLLRRRIAGFYTVAGAFVANGAVNLFMSFSLYYLLAMIVPVFILYWVLQLECDGQSYWESILD